MDDILDVLVIGAGLYGIAAARFYLDIHPNHRLLILERDTHVGGSWNARRLYDTFWSELGVGMSEFADKPMEVPKDIPDGFYEAKYVTKYLEEYVDSHTYSGKTLRDRIKFNTAAIKTEKFESRRVGWRVYGSESLILDTRKLIIATGMTSNPNMPEFPGKEAFQGKVIHQIDFGPSQILSDPNVQHIIVLGGAKSSADMVYGAVKAGKKVTWVIRRSGSGPAAFVKGKGQAGYSTGPEFGTTQIFNFFTPSIMEPSNTLSDWFMNRTWVGQKMQDLLWNSVTTKSQEIFCHPHEAGNGFENLKSNTHVFWCNDSVGLLIHRDFWDQVSRNVQVYREDITALNANSVYLSNGISVPCDALLCGTGWSQSLPLFSQRQAEELGLPYPASATNNEVDRNIWHQLDMQADKKVTQRFPKLSKYPDFVAKKADSKNLTPFRLYRGIAPVSESEICDRSVAFVGCIRTPNSFRTADTQAIWTTAYLTGKLELPDKETMKKAIALVVAWNRRRYPNNGVLGHYYHYDMLPYQELLLKELGLKSHTEGRGLWKFLTHPNLARDLIHMPDEYRKRYGLVKGNNGSDDI